MSLRSRAIVSLSWTLLVAIIVGLVNCVPLASKVETSVDTKDEKQQQSSPRKYLELDDLNGFVSPAASYASGEDLVEGYDHLARNARPKKFAKRDVQQQQQQQRARITRQNQKKPRPGFFWTIARVTFETFNDTRSAIQQISQIINDSLAPETTTKKPKKPLTTKPVVIAPIPSNNNKTSSLTSSSTTEEPTTTTEAEFKLTRPVLQSLIRRNVKGLVRLFNIEWRDALKQSDINVKEFQRDLGKQVGMYLQDNPDAY